MRKKELIKMVADGIGDCSITVPVLKVADIVKVIDAFAEAVKVSVERGESVKIEGFGTFKVRERKVRGYEERMRIPVFRPSDQFRDLVRKKKEDHPEDTQPEEQSDSLT